MLSVVMVTGLLCYGLTWKDAPYASANKGRRLHKQPKKPASTDSKSGRSGGGYSELTQIKTTKLAAENGNSNCTYPKMTDKSESGTKQAVRNGTALRPWIKRSRLTI